MRDRVKKSDRAGALHAVLFAQDALLKGLAETIMNCSMPGQFHPMTGARIGVRECATYRPATAKAFQASVLQALTGF